MKSSEALSTSSLGDWLYLQHKSSAEIVLEVSELYALAWHLVTSAGQKHHLFFMVLTQHKLNLRKAQKHQSLLHALAWHLVTSAGQKHHLVLMALS